MDQIGRTVIRPGVSGGFDLFDRTSGFIKFSPDHSGFVGCGGQQGRVTGKSETDGEGYQRANAALFQSRGFHRLMMQRAGGPCAGGPASSVAQPQPLVRGSGPGPVLPGVDLGAQ